MKNIKCKKCGSIAYMDYGQIFDCPNCSEHEDYDNFDWSGDVEKFVCECGGELTIDWYEDWNEDDYWKAFGGMRCDDCNNEDWKYKE